MVISIAEKRKIIEPPKRGEMTEKVLMYREKVRSTQPKLWTGRLKNLKEVWQEFDTEPVAIKRAMVFERNLTTMDIFIDENPVVGSVTPYLVGVFPQPEYSCRWMKKDIGGHWCHLGEISETEEDKALIREAVDYWWDRCLFSRSQKLIAEVYPEIPLIQILKSGVWTESPISSVWGILVDYEKVLNKGLNQVIREVEEALAKTDPLLFENQEKRNLCRGMLISLNAAIRWAQRYATLAREMAQKEADPERKRELETIAEICQWVPANPARSFREAVQSWWFTWALAAIEDIGMAQVAGRIAKDLGPFYARDKEEGKIDQEEAIELLEMLFVKILSVGRFASFIERQMTQLRMDVNMVLGGVGPDGEDAVTELDWLFLEAQRRVRCTEPTLAVIVHNKMSEDFLLKCIEVMCDTGLGQPSLVNNERTIQHMLKHYKCSLEEARGFTLHGCVQTKVAGKSDNIWQGPFNMAKMVELAYHNGKDPLTGWQLGPKTGEVESFQSYEEFEEAVEKQLRYFVPIMLKCGPLSHVILGEMLPVPFGSALIDDCIETGKDMRAGGARYGYCSAGEPIATIDLANSLAAIKKLVFEDKRITFRELIKALEADFEGDSYSEIQQMCLRAPKYGNDDDYVDLIARKFFDIFLEENCKGTDAAGKPILTEAKSITTHFHLGLHTAALASGRKARIALTDASVSAMPGTDVKGPTALIRSVTKAMDAAKYASNHFNMKFHPSALESTEGRRKLLALIKTYMDLGGHHVQFNVVNTETLKDAQLHPENYRDLLVRVAGFSAYYVLLEEGIQDEIIKRSELRWQ